MNPPLFRLIPIPREEPPAIADPASIPEEATSAIEATRALYDRCGYREPWIGYLAETDAGELIGACGFTAPPKGGQVEIAYFTFPAFEGRGFASGMAGHLLALAARFDPGIEVIAHTLPQGSASTSILRKHGFERAGPILHPEDGAVWLWKLTSTSPRGVSPLCAPTCFKR
jgi:RimJ/RimL family protein N-acetyltransferase